MSLLRAHRWPGTALAAVALALLGYLSRSTLIDLPLLQDAVPARLVIAVVGAAVVLTPLYSAFPVLTPTLRREPTVRALRVAGALGLAALAYLPAVAATTADTAAEVDAATRLYLALLTLALVAVTAVGDYAWLPVLAAGFTALLLSAAPGSPVTAALLAVPSGALLLAVTGAAALYAGVGPRRPPDRTD